ncbi:adenylate/guanylate cyclase domain-containing protein [Acidovorax sp. NCPPB 4044]|uniref:adenylate/guanylate cyclase domain-containing protein n=1 Tax=Acidovorax sp. NCPPB 4044 TaxID=2940490 RepID=UPI002303B34F|nr:adenylate/guanylate cyclase domain-containing protein [Acidovorax sp. NCPPB 4044]MDA8520769.1 FHA domain-containing protein [Acidovorax sp. NCPPB 4044]
MKTTRHTVVFSDIVGTTALYEVQGNARAAAAVTRLVEWMGAVLGVHGGRVVKTLGDGVLAVFGEPGAAVAAATDMARRHHERPGHAGLAMDLRVGMAHGELVEVDGDTYGDAVNIASRLCERAGAREILADAATVEFAGSIDGAAYVRMGQLELRGRAEPLMVYQVEWRQGDEHGLLTQRAGLPSGPVPFQPASTWIELAWAGTFRTFGAADSPLHVGRATQAGVRLADARVSRLHARIEWRGGTIVFTDLSSFGSWVRFDGSETVVALRRSACLLHGSGQIALGVPFGRPDTPTLGFGVTDTDVPESWDTLPPY